MFQNNQTTACSYCAKTAYRHNFEIEQIDSFSYEDLRSLYTNIVKVDKISTEILPKISFFMHKECTALFPLNVYKNMFINNQTTICPCCAKSASQNDFEYQTKYVSFKDLRKDKNFENNNSHQNNDYFKYSS